MEARRHSFGSFVLDAAAGTLSRDGEPVNVGQRGVALLTALLEAEGLTPYASRSMARPLALAAIYGHVGKQAEARQAVERVLALAPHIRVAHLERLAPASTADGPSWLTACAGRASPGFLLSRE